MLYFQHAISGTDLPINSYNDETLKEYANNVEQNYKKNNRNISSKEIQETAKNMYRKADYTHQSITMATHVSPRRFVLADIYGCGRENVKDLSGWEGDTTRNASDMEPSIGTDDYIADLDSVNIVKRMSSKSCLLYTSRCV